MMKINLKCKRINLPKYCTFTIFVFYSTVEVPFPNHHLAEVAYHSLRVDAEPKRSGVTKVLILKDHVLETYVSI